MINSVTFRVMSVATIVIYIGVTKGKSFTLQLCVSICITDLEYHNLQSLLIYLHKYNFLNLNKTKARNKAASIHEMRSIKGFCILSCFHH